MIENRTGSAENNEADRDYTTALLRLETARDSGATKLNLDSLNIARLPPLGEFKELEQLSITSVRTVSDWSSLSELAALKTLKLMGSSIVDLSPLTKLSALKELHCSFTEISDLRPLARLVNLEMLDVCVTNVRDLSPLKDLTALEILWCSGTGVSDLAPIAGLKTLQDLHIDDTKVSDLSPLVTLTSLVTSAIGLRSHLSNLRDFRIADQIPAGIRGLHFERCPLSDPILLSLAEKDTSECTVETFQHLRQQKGLRPLILRPREQKSPYVDWKYGGYTLVEDEQL